MKYIVKNDNQLIFQNRFFDLETKNLLSPIETQNYIIVQVAESHYSRGFSTNEHNQFCDLELTFSHINGLSCSTKGVIENVEKHGLYLSFKGDVHALYSKKSAYFQTLAINLKNGPCLSMLRSIKEKAKTKRSFYAPDISALFAKIINELKLSDAMFVENNLDCLITSILVKIARLGEENPLDDILSYDEKLSAVKDYIDTHFLQIYTLEELSSVFGYTYSYISKAFKKMYGTTPSDYISYKKNEYACTLLKEDAKIEEIAEILGYSSAFNFSRAFKTKNGLPPKEYIKKYKK